MDVVSFVKLELLDAKIGEKHQVPMNYKTEQNEFGFELSYWKGFGKVSDKKTLQLAKKFFTKKGFIGGKHLVIQGSFSAKVIDTEKEKNEEKNISVTFEIFGKFNAQTLKPIFS
jgi:hypothetical protein